MNKTTLIFLGLVIVLSSFVMLKNNDSTLNRLKDDAVILSFGDSLTNGFGASEGASYPEHLARKIGLKIIKSGVNGETSSEGLQRLPQLLENKPDMVILCHGGNDILQKLSVPVLKSNLLQMVQLIKDSGAKVILIGVPEFSLYSLGVHSVYSEVADEQDLILEEKSLKYIESHRSLKSDYVHPNDKGYEHMAQSVVEVLQEHGFIE